MWRKGKEGRRRGKGQRGKDSGVGSRVANWMDDLPRRSKDRPQ